MTGRSEPTLTALQQHQRQPQREQHAHDDDGDEAHRAEGLALNVRDAEQIGWTRPLAYSERVGAVTILAGLALREEGKEGDRGSEPSKDISQKSDAVRVGETLQH